MSIGYPIPFHGLPSTGRIRMCKKKKLEQNIKVKLYSLKLCICNELLGGV